MDITHGHGSTMESIDALFQKREAQYQKLEEMHENRRRQLKELEESIQIKILDLQEKEKRIADRESVCEQRILVLDERERKLRDQDRSLYEEKRSYEEAKKQSEIELEHRKETVRLELAEARYQKELYETKIFELGEKGEGLKLQSVSAQKQLEEMKKRCEEQTDHIESLLKENHDLNLRLQESEQRKNELFRKMFANQSNDEEKIQETIIDPISMIEEETDQEIYQEEDYAHRSIWEKDPVEVLAEEIPLTADVLKHYLDEEGVENQLKHTAQGDMVEILFDQLRIMICFMEEPFYAIHKKAENSRAVRMAIKDLNASQDEVDFQYDIIAREVIAQGSFEIHTSAEQLMDYMNSVKERYFEEDGT